MSRLYGCIILILIAVLCAIWSPWNSWNISIAQLFGIEPPKQIGGLQVTSLAGELEVFIDGQSRGKVNTETSPLLIPAVTPGERQIRLVRTSQVTGAYWEFNRLIKFESGVDVVLSFELGPTEEFSEGHLIYATKNNELTENLLLAVNSGVDGAEVLVDDLRAGTTPLAGYVLTRDKQHRVVISAPGYETQEFTILPEDQTQRDKLKGFYLNVDVNLFLLPIAVD